MPAHTFQTLHVAAVSARDCNRSVSDDGAANSCRTLEPSTYFSKDEWMQSITFTKLVILDNLRDQAIPLRNVGITVQSQVSFEPERYVSWLLRTSSHRLEDYDILLMPRLNPHLTDRPRATFNSSQPCGRETHVQLSQPRSAVVCALSMRTRGQGTITTTSNFLALFLDLNEFACSHQGLGWDLEALKKVAQRINQPGPTTLRDYSRLCYILLQKKFLVPPRLHGHASYCTNQPVLTGQSLSYILHPFLPIAITL
jgi:hypothetical protein